MSAKPISLGDVAREAGVSRMAASLALRNQSGVSNETRVHVQEVAKKLGYAPDSRVASWLAKVRGSKARSPVPVAWVNTDVERGAWQKFKFFEPYYQGAFERCAELGYKLEEFWARDPGISKKRLSEILYQRGIQAVIIAPSRDQSIFHFMLEWKNFACVSFEKALLAPRLNRVISDYYYNFRLTLKMLRRFGYRRIGVFQYQFIDRRTQHAYWSAITQFHMEIPQSERVPAIFNPEFEHDQSELCSWLKRYKVDVVVGQHSGLVDFVTAAGFKVPEEVGVVHTALDGDCSDWAGIWIRKKEIGATAANMVISQLHGGQQGLPPVAMDTLVPGLWHPGKTLLTPKASRSQRVPVKSSKTRSRL